jgi:hypothetical protein
MYSNHKFFRSAFPFVEYTLRKQSPMCDMHYLNKVLSICAVNEINAPLFSSIDDTGNNVLIDGKVVYLSNIKDAVLRLSSEAERDMTNILLLGEVPLIKVDIVNDKPRCSDIGYSYVDDLANGFKKHDLTVIRMMLNNPIVSGKFHRIQGGEIVWNPAACWDWLHQVEEVMLKLFNASMLSCGTFFSSPFIIC